MHYFLNKEFYTEFSFYINSTMGLSVIFAFFLVLYTSYFSFCSVSRITAWTQLIITLAYLIIQEDNVYNIVFQTIIMFLALLFTAYFYIKKYPNCKVAIYVNAKIYTAKLWNEFLESLSKNQFNCEKALNDYQHKRKIHYERQS